MATPDQYANMDMQMDYDPNVAADQNTIHQEVVIDIHVRHLKLQINEIMNQKDDLVEGQPIDLPVRIVWSRGKK